MGAVRMNIRTGVIATLLFVGFIVYAVTTSYFIASSLWWIGIGLLLPLLVATLFILWKLAYDIVEMHFEKQAYKNKRGFDD